MSEKVKIKYRTDKKRCNPEYTEYLEDQKFQLGEHEFTPHKNKYDSNIPVDDFDYEMLRFIIAYIKDNEITSIKLNHSNGVNLYVSRILYYCRECNNNYDDHNYHYRNCL